MAAVIASHAHIINRNASKSGGLQGTGRMMNSLESTKNVGDLPGQPSLQQASFAPGHISQQRQGRPIPHCVALPHLRTTAALRGLVFGFGNPNSCHLRLHWCQVRQAMLTYLGPRRKQIKAPPTSPPAWPLHRRQLSNQSPTGPLATQLELGTTTAASSMLRTAPVVN